ncbi:hypothetical protein QWZ10_02575 [Paracoccus cavernae]|uniref:Helix-turn-helix domain-containing protein n=1 Tax=Paracoccus cavernae TaxID=1571207 RepID=A0ABT8D6D5_9RHOB|nr:hypothetical protein [Paracoccus cavernae]
MRGIFFVTEIFDLFGNPMRGGSGKRGRPAFQWTPELFNKIKLMLALGWPNDRMAGAVGVSSATLKRHFRAELAERDVARDQLTLRRFELAMQQANKGNLGAVKELGRMVDQNDAALADARIRAGQSRGRGGRSRMTRRKRR